MRRDFSWKMLLAISLACITLLSGCTLPARQLHNGYPASHYWSGRMALQVQDEQQQSFSAGFELQGQPDRGTLLIFSPLGSTIARLQWTPSAAMLQQGNQLFESESLTELIVRMSGSDIPVAALFDWLQGKNTAVEGWQADLTRISEGRLRAERTTPVPEVSLRIVLDQDAH